MIQVEVNGMRRWLGMIALGVSFALVPLGQAAAQARALPDFTDLVEQVGPSVVNIRTLEKVSARTRQGGGQDEEMLEFLRRFGVPIPNQPRQAPRQNRPQPQEEEQPRGGWFRLHPDCRRVHHDQCPCGRRSGRGNRYPDR